GGALRVLKPHGRLGVSSQRRSLATQAQDVFFASLVALARRHHLQVPRLSAERANFGEPEMLPGILEVAGFKHVKTTQMVTGGRVKGAEAWMELMAGAGPLPYTMLGVLGPLLGFQVMERMGDSAAFISAGGYHHHIGLNTWESKGGTAPPPGHTGLYHTAVLYPSRKALAEVLQRLVEHGYPLTGASDHGVSE